MQTRDSFAGRKRLYVCKIYKAGWYCSALIIYLVFAKHVTGHFIEEYVYEKEYYACANKFSLLLAISAVEALVHVHMPQMCYGWAT